MKKSTNIIGLKDMHPMQVKALMDFVGTAVELAANTQDREIVSDVEAMADELVRLFGGNGVRVTINDECVDDPRYPPLLH